MTQSWAVADNVRRARHFIRALVGREVYVPLQEHCPTICLGSRDARWCICPLNLREDSVVYSFGVGTDISFDLELIDRFGVQVHAFDPTPRSISWLKSQNLPDRFIFHDYGVSDHDGTSIF